MVILDDDLSEGESLHYKEKYYLPLLYSIDKKGKERLWKNWVEDDTVYRVSGIVDGKKQTFQRTFKGKNIGKKNETTPHVQAKQTAEKMWVEQIDKGYLPKCKEGKSLLKKLQKGKEETGGHNINASAIIGGRKCKTVKKRDDVLTVDTVTINITPMKAGIWEHTPDNPRDILPKTLKYFDLKKGVYLQHKLDGWRCIARLQENSIEFSSSDEGSFIVVLTTNNQKQYPWFKSLRDDILNFIIKSAKLLKVDPLSIILDGELYSHILYDEHGTLLTHQARFSTISSMCGISRSSPHPLEDQLNYVIFDLVDLSKKESQDVRFDRLNKMFEKDAPESILRCGTQLGYSVDDIINYHNEISQQGYEGVIIRSRDLKYEQKRSLHIRKYKYFIDREYTVIDIHKDEGVDDHYFSWICCDYSIIDPSTKKAVCFRATPKADEETKKEWCKNYKKYIGKSACIKFQEYSKDNIPRFPNMVGFREDQ